MPKEIRLRDKDTVFFWFYGCGRFWLSEAVYGDAASSGAGFEAGFIDSPGGLR